MISTGSIEELHEFMRELNRNKRNVCLTYNYHQTQIPFLDLNISIKDGSLVTSTFRKETAANTLLYATSHHPDSLVQGIPICQFLRIRRNCTELEQFKKEVDTRFRERGYSPHRTLRRAKKRAYEAERNQLLQTSDTQKQNKVTIRCKQIGYITKYGAQWKEFKEVLNKHLHILASNSQLARLVGLYPQMVARRANNLKDLLVHSEFSKTPPADRQPKITGTYPCGQCSICTFVVKN